MTDTVKLDVEKLEEVLRWLLSLDEGERENVIAEAKSKMQTEV